MSSTALDAKEVFAAIQRGLPNIATYLRVVLKREKLSEEAESLRMRYDTILGNLEQGVFPSFGRRFSVEDDGGYFSGNRVRISEIHDHPRLPIISHSGYLLRRDDKYRWHRSWCRLESRDMKFYIYEDNNEEALVKSFSVENTTPRFGSSTIPDCDKENCFTISGISHGVGDGRSSVAMTPDGETTPTLIASSPQMSDEIYFAAYSDADLHKWKEALHLLTSSRESGRISIEGGTWLAPATHDSASTSSSNFSSNRESIISTTSSLLTNNRMSTRSDTLDRDHTLTDEFRAMSLSKQQQPLPSPPPLHGPEESAKAEDDDDNASGGTIYESIDNLVQQFDETIRETAQAMGQIGQSMKSGGKKRKRKDRSLFRQTSFLASLGKSSGSKSKLFLEKKAELEKGERFAGYLFKKNSNGSWKKKWCVLKGAVFTYYKSAETDSHGQEYVILDADIRTFEDPKRSFTFSLKCQGVPEMYFSSEDEDTQVEWLSKLAAASNAPDNTGFSEEWAALQEEHAMMDDPKRHVDSVYRMPRPISMDGSVYDIPPGRPGPPTAATLPPGLSAEAAIESGLYSVPRALFNASEEAAQQLPPPPPNPFDIYDIPRSSMSPDMEDEEGIYDVPLDILDFEIYDYPPDVMELGLEPLDSGLDTTRNSTITVSSDYTVTERASSAISEDSWSTFSSFQPGMRPSMAFSMASSEDLSPRHSMISVDTSVFNYPRSNVSSEYIPSPMPPPVENTSGSREMLAHGTMTPDIESQMNEAPLEYGQCQMRGNLHKRERFMTWTKLYCTIRNNFLECHKSSGDHYTPALKLFLPGSEVKEGGGDAKKRWALQVKHPRRDGVLTFATDSRENLHLWIKAFQAGSSIEVQSVHTVEQIRITDLDMQKKWVSLETNALIDHTPTPSPMMEDFSTSTLPRRKTFSHQDEYQSDTLKRRRKFSWVKSGLIKRRGKKTVEGAGGSQGDLQNSRVSQMSFDIVSPSSDMLPPYAPDPMRKSMSLELLPSGPETEESPARVCAAHESVNSDGKVQFQGYLRVQRKGADSLWVRYWCVLEDKMISCYISRKDFTLALSIPLKGSRITEATLECKRDHSFKVWHIESGQCLFFAAENGDELHKWFNHVTQGAERTVPDNVSVGSNSGPFVGFFYVPDDKQNVDHSNSASRLNDMVVNADDPTQPAITVQSPSPSSVFYRGKLKKQAHTGKWKDRYCVIKSGSLNIFHSSLEKSPITSIVLQGCSLELSSVPPGCEHQFLFKLNPQGGSKSHTFAAPNETEMFAWVSALRDSSQEKQLPPELRTQVSAENGTGSGGSSTSSPSLSGKNTLKRRSKKLKDANLVSYVPASSLKNPEHCGFIEIQFISEPWTRYWCVSNSDNCLYIYEDQNSEATIKTICLPGYELKVIDPQISKRPYTISINHPGISPVLLAANDQADLNMWLFVLERGTKAEFCGKSTAKRVVGSSKNLLNDVKVLSHKVSSKSGGATKKKGPMKADHTIGTVKASEEGGGSADSSPTSLTGKTESSHGHHSAIIRRYEKRIRKTHKVANQTEERLKYQQTNLLHFKKELSKHIVKLVELANGGDPQATKRLKNIRVKLQQLDKIVPYLGKYVAVNRQAEMQTVAVLRESCTMELRTLGRSPGKEGLKPSPRGHRGTSPLSKLLTTEGIKEEEDENAAELQDERMTGETTAESAATEGDHMNGEGEGVAAGSSVVLVETENPYASLSEIRNQAQAENKPTSNYAELHFSRNGDAAKVNVRPPSVNYAEVKINPSGRNFILTPDAVALQYDEDRETEQHYPPTIMEEESQDGSSVQDTTLTPENAALEASTSSMSSHSPRRPLSPMPPPSHPPPPPPSNDSPIHQNHHQTPPVSPITHDHHSNKGNGELETSTIVVAEMTSPVITQAQSTTVVTELRRAEAKAKSPPPPVAKKPSSKQSTPVHRLNHPTQNGVEGSGRGEERSPPPSSNVTCSPTHKDMMTVMGSAPSLMDRIKALQKK